MFSFDLSNTDWWVVLSVIFAAILARVGTIAFSHIKEHKKMQSLISMLKDLENVNMNEAERIKYAEFREYVFNSLPQNNICGKTITPLIVCMLTWCVLTVIGFFFEMTVYYSVSLFFVFFLGGVIGNISYELGVMNGRKLESRMQLIKTFEHIKNQEKESQEQKQEHSYLS